MTLAGASVLHNTGWIIFFYTGPCRIDFFPLNNKHVYLETEKHFFTYSLRTSLHVQAMSMHVSNGRYFYLVTEANTLP